MKKVCPVCDGNVVGRIDKVFCSEQCKNSHHQHKRKDRELLYKTIDRQLKRNRRILNLFNKAGKSTVRKENLIQQGFNPNYFTNYWKNSKGDVYLFVYEFGFLARSENGKHKYILVKWQDYMK